MSEKFINVTVKELSADIGDIPSVPVTVKLPIIVSKDIVKTVETKLSEKVISGKALTSQLHSNYDDEININVDLIGFDKTSFPFGDVFGKRIDNTQLTVVDDFYYLADKSIEETLQNTSFIEKLSNLGKEEIVGLAEITSKALDKFYSEPCDTDNVIYLNLDKKIVLNVSAAQALTFFTDRALLTNSSLFDVLSKTLLTNKEDSILCDDSISKLVSLENPELVRISGSVIANIQSYASENYAQDDYFGVNYILGF